MRKFQKEVSFFSFLFFSFVFSNIAWADTCTGVDKCGIASLGCGNGKRCVQTYDSDGEVEYVCLQDDSCVEESILQCGYEGQSCCSGTPCHDGLVCIVADDVCTKIISKTYNPATEEPFIDISALLSATFSLLYPAALLLGFLYIIVAGYKYMTGEGDPQKIKEAQNDLSASISGILFIVLSATLLRIIIEQILGGALDI